MINRKWPATFAIELDYPGGSICTSKGRTVHEAWDKFLASDPRGHWSPRARTIEDCTYGYDTADVYPIVNGHVGALGDKPSVDR